MRLHRIPTETETLPTALPRNMPGGSTGVLLLHGFTGTPRDLADLGERLHAGGLAVSIPRLPGHGTNGRDFLQTGWRDWLRTAVDAFSDLRARCATVHVIGFSMGGVLAVLLAARFAVGKLVLLAPALRATNPLLPFSPLLSLFIRRVRWPVTSPVTVVDPDYAVQEREYWSWRYCAQAASLLKIQRMARHALHSVTADTLTLIGRRDRSVPLSVIRLLERGMSSARTRFRVFEKASHHILAGEQGDLVVEEVLCWLAPRLAAR